MWIFCLRASSAWFKSPVTRTRSQCARIKGDIESVFPEACAEADKGTDYKYRARVSRQAVAQVLHDQVMGLHWSNFKARSKATSAMMPI